MVGILLSYWGGLFSGAMLVSGRVLGDKVLVQSLGRSCHPGNDLMFRLLTRFSHVQLEGLPNHKPGTRLLPAYGPICLDLYKCLPIGRLWLRLQLESPPLKACLRLLAMSSYAQICKPQKKTLAEHAPFLFSLPKIHQQSIHGILGCLILRYTEYHWTGFKHLKWCRSFWNLSHKTKKNCHRSQSLVAPPENIRAQTRRRSTPIH